jgi:MFS family permease
MGIFVTYVPITGVSIALTNIGQATHASTSDLQWVSDGYVIPMAAAVLSAGLFGDRYGRRRIFLIGIALTVIGAATAAAAGLYASTTAIHLLWAGQAVSGLGAGMLMPATLALIGHAAPDPKDRGKYIGMWATGLLLGLAAGPVRAENFVQCSDRQGCPPGHPAVMLTVHLPAVRLPPGHAGRSVAACVPA